MQNLFSYQGKRVLVCGCFSGMGEAAAKIARSLGAEVVAVDIKKPSFDYSKFLEVDLRDPVAIEQMLKDVSGSGRIDRLFYCAGLPGTFPAVDVMRVNFIGLRHTVERCAPLMPKTGAIVSISSGAGMAWQMMLDKVMPLLMLEEHAASVAWVEKNQKEPWFECYSFSKMCTIAYTLRRAATLAPATGVRLNCISPGPTDTPMMPAFIQGVGAEFMAAYPRPLGRNSSSEEQGWPLVFLNSDAASYVNGENLFTDGGTTGGIFTGSVKPPVPPAR